MAQAQLHGALEQLARLSWADVPQDDLAGFLSPCFSAGELLINSVPLPPNGTPFESAQPHFQTPNTAKSISDLYPSPARPRSPHDTHASLRKHWAKPMKFGQKENPLNVALYKMAGHDRHGAWFARHNIVEGIGFNKFKKALRREFAETLLTQGEPGAGAIRGLSAERRVERKDVKDVGRLEVYQLSAQMPSPVTPREFMTLNLTTDQGLSEKSPSIVQNGNEYQPRHFMMVSKALDHPEIPERSTFVRGMYESVELVREIPLHLLTETDPELNPVEWIMVTRSDPAGGIPRFLIERGTPGAMLTDVTKFLNWACAHDEIPEPDADADKQQEASEKAKDHIQEEDASQDAQAADNVRRKSAPRLDASTASNEAAQSRVLHPDRSTDGTDESHLASPEPVTAVEHQPQESGLMSNLSSTLEAGVSTYAPVSISNFVQRQLHPEGTPAEDVSDSESSSDSFMSAEEMETLTTASEGVRPDPAETASVTSMGSVASSGESAKVEKRNLNEHDKEVSKIVQQRERLDEKLAKKRQAEETRFRTAQEKDQSDHSKAKERLDQELKKTEERHRKEVEKLEAKRQKELKKAEERRKKKNEQNKLTLVARERDDLRSQADLLRRENSLLSDQVSALQRENTALAKWVGKLGGPDAMKNVQEDIKKTYGTKSTSHLSLASSGSSEKKEAGS